MMPAGARAAPSPSTQVGVAPPAKAVFEYVGATALTVVSPITRKTYRFAQPGARLEVDARDRSWIAFVPNLARAP
jgi:hypothetical protein